MIAAGRVIKPATAGAVAGIEAMVSYEHVYALVRAHGEAGRTGRPVSLTMDGLIYATSVVFACPLARPYDWTVRSDASDIDSYVAQVPEERRAILIEIRDACRRLLAGFAESMSHGMPTYSRDGTAEVAWASQNTTSPCT